jgi:hypothetical protein
VRSGERDAIVAAALDYFEGWFDGDVARMERALHRELVKRSPSGDTLDETTAAEMVDATRRGVGRSRDVKDRRIEVDVVDMHRDVACVVVRSAVCREYLQLARTEAGWKIVNALWTRA